MTKRKKKQFLKFYNRRVTEKLKFIKKYRRDFLSFFYKYVCKMYILADIQWNSRKIKIYVDQHPSSFLGTELLHESLCL